MASFDFVWTSFTTSSLRYLSDGDDDARMHVQSFPCRDANSPLLAGPQPHHPVFSDLGNLPSLRGSTRGLLLFTTFQHYLQVVYHICLGYTPTYHHRLDITPYFVYPRRPRCAGQGRVSVARLCPEATSLAYCGWTALVHTPRWKAIRGGKEASSGFVLLLNSLITWTSDELSDAYSQ